MPAATDIPDAASIDAISVRISVSFDVCILPLHYFFSNLETMNTAIRP
jgi:hypothetical protein